MLRLIEIVLPAPAHRAGLRLAHAVRKRWWRVRRPQLIGCRVIALDPRARVLLIRHSYGNDQWMLPGGGMKPGEDPLVAAMRELGEEAGCGLRAARVIAVLDATTFGAPNRVHIITGEAEGEIRPDGREIIEAAFFALDALPDAMHASLREQLPEWVRAMSARPA